MTDKKNTGGISRRGLIGSGSVVALGAAASKTQAAPSSGKIRRWDIDTDVVVVGAGAAGLPAALRARELGAKVVVIEENTDVGGHAIVGNAYTNLGGGNALQQKYGIKDSADDIYLEYTRPDHPMTRYNDRELVRSFADHNVEVYDYLVAKGVMFTSTPPHRPTGLVRYDSQKAFSGARTRWLRPRTILYFGLLLVGASVASWAISTVKPANFGVTRMTGAPYIVDEGTVRNQFLVRIVNKRNAPAQFVVRVDHAPDGIKQTGFERAVQIGAMGELVQPLILQQQRATYHGPFHFRIGVEEASGKFKLYREAEFLGPEARLLREDEEEKREHDRRKK